MRYPDEDLELLSDGLSAPSDPPGTRIRDTEGLGLHDGSDGIYGGVYDYGANILTDKTTGMEFAEVYVKTPTNAYLYYRPVGANSNTARWKQ